MELRWAAATTLFAVSVAGCASVPGNTTANSTLQSDTSKMILLIDRATDKPCTQRQISNTEVLSASSASIEERWTVDRCGKPVGYLVTFVPGPGGGTDYRIELERPAATPKP